MTALPPDLSTAAAISAESVATTTGPSFAACARRRTCTIIGSPAISASGLPGSRVDAIRAGIRTITPVMESGLYVLQDARQTGYFGGAPLAGLGAIRSPVPMNSFELNKVLGAVLGTCLF